MKIKDYKTKARLLLRGKYGILIAARFIEEMISYAAIIAMIMVLGAAAAFILEGNAALGAGGAILFAVVLIAAVLICLFISLGISKQYLNMCRRGYVSFSDLFYAFSRGAHPLRYVWVSLWLIFILFVPGVIILLALLTLSILSFDNSPVVLVISYAAFYIYVIYMSLRYAFAPVIVIDRPSLGVFAAMKRSARLTKGRKLKLIWLFCFSFLPWGIPLLLTLGIAALWITPYIYTTVFLFYLDAEREAFPEDSYGDISTEDIEPGMAADAEETETREVETREVEPKEVETREAETDKEEDKEEEQHEVPLL